jgi:hypothetical protein
MSPAITCWPPLKDGQRKRLLAIEAETHLDSGLVEHPVVVGEAGKLHLHHDLGTCGEVRSPPAVVMKRAADHLQVAPPALRELRLRLDRLAPARGEMALALLDVTAQVTRLFTDLRWRWLAGEGELAVRPFEIPADGIRPVELSSLSGGTQLGRGSIFQLADSRIGGGKLGLQALQRLFLSLEPHRRLPGALLDLLLLRESRPALLMSVFPRGNGPVALCGHLAQNLGGLRSAFPELWQDSDFGQQIPAPPLPRQRGLSHGAHLSCSHHGRGGLAGRL